jgi:hypothetical protein
MEDEMGDLAKARQKYEYYGNIALEPDASEVTAYIVALEDTVHELVTALKSLRLLLDEVDQGALEDIEKVIAKVEGKAQ